MRAKTLLLGSMFAFGGLWGAQETVKNPEKPAGPNAGRVLNLREVLRITDAGGEFFLRYPYILKTGADSSIYLYDREQLIRFDSRGRFLGNLYKKGQGPGELNYVSNFDPVGDLLLVHSSDPERLVWFDEKGKAVRELSLTAAGGRMDYVFHTNDRFYFFKHGFPSERGKAAPVDLSYSLVAISDDGRAVRVVAGFITKALFVGAAMTWDNLLTTVMKGRYFFVAYGNPYLIKVFDCREERLLRGFSRPYKRVPRPKDSRAAGIISPDGRRYEMPGSEYIEDIAAVFAVGDELWVRTSTKDPEKGILFDVYNVEGHYVDAFYLKTAGRPLAVEGDAVFIVERTPDETVEIAKYRIVR